MKKILKSNLFIMMLVAIVSSLTTVVASNYISSDIAYTPSDSNWHVSNVAEAINSIELSKVSTNYSTEEKVVGTWVDGKPLYQKTVYISAFPNSADLNVAHGIQNLDKVINISGYAYNGSNQFLTIPRVTGSNNLNIDVDVLGANIRISVGSNLSHFSGHITLQYTKTTDQASNS